MIPITNRSYENQEVADKAAKPSTIRTRQLPLRSHQFAYLQPLWTHWQHPSSSSSSLSLSPSKEMPSSAKFFYHHYGQPQAQYPSDGSMKTTIRSTQGQDQDESPRLQGHDDVTAKAATITSDFSISDDDLPSPVYNQPSMFPSGSQQLGENVSPSSLRPTSATVVSQETLQETDVLLQEELEPVLEFADDIVATSHDSQERPQQESGPSTSVIFLNDDRRQMELEVARTTEPSYIVHIDYDSLLSSTLASPYDEEEHRLHTDLLEVAITTPLPHEDLTEQMYFAATTFPNMAQNEGIHSSDVVPLDSATASLLLKASQTPLPSPDSIENEFLRPRLVAAVETPAMIPLPEQDADELRYLTGAVNEEREAEHHYQPRQLLAETVPLPKQRLSELVVLIYGSLSEPEHILPPSVTLDETLSPTGWMHVSPENVPLPKQTTDEVDILTSRQTDYEQATPSPRLEQQQFSRIAHQRDEDTKEIVNPTFIDTQTFTFPQHASSPPSPQLHMDINPAVVALPTEDDAEIAFFSRDAESYKGEHSHADNKDLEFYVPGNLVEGNREERGQRCESWVEPSLVNLAPISRPEFSETTTCATTLHSLEQQQKEMEQQGQGYQQHAIYSDFPNETATLPPPSPASSLLDIEGWERYLKSHDQESSLLLDDDHLEAVLTSDFGHNGSSSTESILEGMPTIATNNESAVASNSVRVDTTLTETSLSSSSSSSSLVTPSSATQKAADVINPYQSQLGATLAAGAVTAASHVAAAVADSVLSATVSATNEGVSMITGPKNILAPLQLNPSESVALSLLSASAGAYMASPATPVSPRSHELAQTKRQLQEWMEIAQQLRAQETILTDQIDNLVAEMASLLDHVAQSDSEMMSEISSLEAKLQKVMKMVNIMAPFYIVIFSTIRYFVRLPYS
ncbi:hypothetical protein BGW41_005407 [Actinomortierella wolfii]|nr:hypothetical protein BGW41_005407 [Actinomortierella wolfii]